MTRKADELYFWDRMKREVGGLPQEMGAKKPRDIINEPDFPLHHKRAWYLLQKWTDRNWYEYGVTLDLGWVTEEGMEVEL